MPRSTSALAALALALPVALTGCSVSAGDGPAVAGPNAPATVAARTGAATCPAQPVRVTVTVNQWGDIAGSLGGTCATTTAIITSASVDPHDYEPTPSDIATFTDAELVVSNGAGYDDWAGKALATAKVSPAVVDAGKVVGVAAGGNPHLFYSPAYVARTADAVTAELTRLRPAAAAYFARANQVWKAAQAPLRAELARVAAAAAGRSYEATESVADYLAAAAGLANVTPEGYRVLGEEDEPTPGDIAAFQRALRSGKVALLVFNTQTEGAVPQQFRATAEQAGVPVVEVTETVPDQLPTYEAWQLSVVHQIAAALGVA